MNRRTWKWTQCAFGGARVALSLALASAILISEPVLGASHYVKTGETLWGLAKEHNVSVSKLAALNGFSSRTRIKRGQRIEVPDRPTAAQVYSLKRGESLTDVSRKFGVSVSAIRAANEIRNDRSIPVGYQLRIPGTAVPTPSASPLVHRVAPGETVNRIAARYDVAPLVLQKANGISNPRNLSVGTKLAIPGKVQRPSASSSSTKRANPGYHVVQAGEVLSVIAESYGVGLSKVKAANGIRNENRIVKGQRLIIPKEGVESSIRAASNSRSAAPTHRVHIVKRGEYLTMIADRYKVEYAAIARANGLRNPRVLEVGQKLVIPSGSSSIAMASLRGSRSVAKPRTTTHRIRRGESLAHIANRYNVSVRDIIDQNGISNPNLIVPGRTLQIPLDGVVRRSTRSSGPVLPYATQRTLTRISASRGVWKNIVLHHSAVARASVKGMDRHHREVRHMKNGLAYHFVIGNGHEGLRDGEIYIGDRWKRQIAGGHLRSAARNADSIGICLVGNFEKTRPSQKQLEATAALVKWLSAELSIPEYKVTTHTLIHPGHTLCPGKHLSLTQIKNMLH